MQSHKTFLFLLWEWNSKILQTEKQFKNTLVTSPLAHASSCEGLARGNGDPQDRRLGYLSLPKSAVLQLEQLLPYFPLWLTTNLALNTSQIHYLECLALFVIFVVFHMNFLPEYGGYINDGESCFNTNSVLQWRFCFQVFSSQDYNFRQLNISPCLGNKLIIVTSI